jgi:hypothetical protein
MVEIAMLALDRELTVSLSCPVACGHLLRRIERLGVEMRRQRLRVGATPG